MRVPKSTLEMRGFNPSEGHELVRLQVVWSSQGSGRVEDVFANYYPSDRRAEAYLGRLDHGVQFTVVSAERYDYLDFVKDFEESKPLNLANVKLGVDGEAIWMDVDGRRIVLSECLLNTFGSMVNLRGKLGNGKPEIKFEYDGKSAAARFKGRPLIEYVQVQGDELEIKYAQSRAEKHFYRVNLKGC